MERMRVSSGRNKFFPLKRVLKGGSISEGRINKFLPSRTVPIEITSCNIMKRAASLVADETTRNFPKGT